MSTRSFSKEMFLEDLSKLVSFDTVTYTGPDLDKAMDFIREKIHPDGHVQILHNRVEDPKNEGKIIDNQILIASNKETLTPDICYLVHVDVVPAKPHQFTMQVNGDTAIGRGVSDMKFSIPMGYGLLNELIARNSDISFALVVTSDEERGGFLAAKWLADNQGYSPKALIVPDGGEDFVLINKSKAVCQLKVSMDGTPAHASRPWDGKNALVPVVETAHELNQKYKDANQTDGWHTTVNIGMLHGGERVNQVPPHAELELDFRFPADIDSIEGLTAMVNEIAHKIDPNLKVEQTALGDPTFVDTESAFVQLFAQCVLAEREEPMKIEGAEGSTDARHFNKKGAVPFIMSKPKSGDNHGDNEYLDIPSALIYYRVLQRFLVEYEATINQ